MVNPSQIIILGDHMNPPIRSFNLNIKADPPPLFAGSQYVPPTSRCHTPPPAHPLHTRSQSPISVDPPPFLPFLPKQLHKQEEVE